MMFEALGQTALQRKWKPFTSSVIAYWFSVRISRQSRKQLTDSCLGRVWRQATRNEHYNTFSQRATCVVIRLKIACELKQFRFSYIENFMLSFISTNFIAYIYVCTNCYLDEMLLTPNCPKMTSQSVVCPDVMNTEPNDVKKYMTEQFVPLSSRCVSAVCISALE